MLKIYTDESGDLGLNEGYFIIAMLLVKNPNRMKNIVKNFCAENGKEELHSSELTFNQKQKLVSKISKMTDYEVSYIVADKMMIKNKSLFRDNNILFNFLFSFLIKDVFKANIDDINICLDNRIQKVSSNNSLKDYIKTKARGEWGFEKEMDISYFDSKKCKTIQIADLVASCIRKKYVHKKDGLYNQLNIKKSIRFPRGLFRLDI